MVGLSDSAREYNTETLRADPSGLLIMVLTFFRANNESLMKGMRVADAFARKRQRFAGGEALNKPCTRRLDRYFPLRKSPARLPHAGECLPECIDSLHPRPFVKLLRTLTRARRAFPISALQIIEVVVMHLQEHPEDLHERAGVEAPA